MTAKRLRRPGQLGKLSDRQVEDRAPDRSEDSAKDQAAVALGRKGGKGGKARAAKMAPEKRAQPNASARPSIALKATPIPRTFRPATRNGKI
jgi:hypothetical protein